MKELFLLIFIIFNYSYLYSHTNNGDTIAFSGSKQLFVGFGNYEMLHVGFKKNYHFKKYYEFAIGAKPYGFESETYSMTYFSFGKRLVTKYTNVYPAIQLKTMVWRLDNSSYTFTFLGLNPELRLFYRISDTIEISGSGGVIYNTMLIYKRKTFSEVGWPKEFQPSFSLNVHFLFNEKGN